jgi:hypothetical protein
VTARANFQHIAVHGSEIAFHPGLIYQGRVVCSAENYMARQVLLVDKPVPVAVCEMSDRCQFEDVIHVPSQVSTSLARLQHESAVQQCPALDARVGTRSVPGGGQ